MSDLLLDAMNVVALHRGVQEIAKIRETCKEASQLEILNERFQSEYEKWVIPNYAAYVIQQWWYYLPYTCSNCDTKKPAKGREGNIYDIRRCTDCDDERYELNNRADYDSE